ncbi:hypothetical protein EUGRSUZ_C01972 [Eucalyptus grandis]|uniref:Uncharacterized protein n=2 Tax=Eucalyptus grandis TaxID=71139 RepID=A0ACC3LE91_EUCGR|nr:hypothetical protein EUGRSUZ_C01972 [Eucalyptus grandis]
MKQIEYMFQVLMLFSASTTPNSPSKAPGMNIVIEVPWPANVTIFEFGSITINADEVTFAGYCLVSSDLEPCYWEVLPAASSDAP